MASIFVTDHAGRETEVLGREGLSVMEIIRDAGFNDLLALCGGCCSCATCHVYVSGDKIAALTPMGSDENELLTMSDVRTEESRLSCQLRFEDRLDGLRVTIAPSD